MTNLREEIDRIIGYWDFAPQQDEDLRVKRIGNEIEALIQKSNKELLERVREALGDNWQPHCEEYDNITSRNISCVTCYNRLQRNYQLLEMRQAVDSLESDERD